MYSFRNTNIRISATILKDKKPTSNEYTQKRTMPSNRDKKRRISRFLAQIAQLRATLFSGPRWYFTVKMVISHDPESELVEHDDRDQSKLLQVETFHYQFFCRSSTLVGLVWSNDVTKKMMNVFRFFYG